MLHFSASRLTFDKEMNFSDLACKERERYFSCLEKSLANHRELYPKATAEVLIEMNSEKYFGPYKLIRPDIIYKDQNEKVQIVEVNQDSYLSFEAYLFTIVPDIPITLSPFHWNGIEFRLYGNTLDFSPLASWIDYWLDPEDKRYIVKVDFLGVIHSVLPPKFIDPYWELCIDFGSADIGAISELFGLFHKMGVTKAEMGSFSMIG